MSNSSGTSGVRRLVLLRHATAAPSAAADQDRALTEHGRAEARAVGAWLLAQGHLPDLALVSGARRTRETWRLLGDEAGLDADGVGEMRDALYTAGPETALDLVRGIDPDVTTLLLLGHNPTVASLAHLLHDSQGSEAAAVRMAQGYPPASVTVLAVPVPWAELGWGSSRLVDFRPPFS